MNVVSYIAYVMLFIAYIPIMELNRVFKNTIWFDISEVGVGLLDVKKATSRLEQWHSHY